MDTITAHATTTNTPILALDLGEYKSVVCLFRSPDDVRSMGVPTTIADLHRLIEKHRPKPEELFGAALASRRGAQGRLPWPRTIPAPRRLRTPTFKHEGRCQNCGRAFSRTAYPSVRVLDSESLPGNRLGS